MSDRDRHRVRLIGGPFDGKLADAIDAQPGITVVMNRIPDDGPMVRDLYLCTEIGDDGVPLASYVCTEAAPEPAVADDEPGNRVPALDPAIVATANTFRYLAEWFGSEEQRAELYKMAEAVEAATPDCDYSCPVCEETICDEGCPLAPVRSRWYEAALKAHAKASQPSKDLPEPTAFVAVLGDYGGMFNRKRTGAVRGMTPGKYFAPFYDHARRFAGLSPATVDAYLAAHGTAETGAGGIITLNAEGMQPHVANVAPQHRANMARWVNDFNARSRG